MIDVGLLFGSFNPVHTGHLLVAQHFIRERRCAEVWLVVSPQNPLKSARDLAPAEHRLEMVRRAIAGNAALQACDLEFHLPLPSYTIDTLNALKSLYPGTRFAPILGEDVLADFPRWKSWERILHEFHVFTYPRHGSQPPSPEIPGALLPEAVRAPRIEISATDIRAAVAAGSDIRYLVPEAVEEYIRLHGLYR